MTKFLEKILHFGLYAVPFTALIVVPGTVFPFIFGRTIIFQILIELLAIAWLILAVKRPVKIKKSAVFYAVGAFLAVNFLATIFSVSPHVSFWGKAMRMDGFLFLSHLFLWFFLVAGEWRDKKDWQRFFVVVSAVAVVLSAFGFVKQYSSIFSFYGFIEVGRFTSLMGNSSFFGNYLIIPIFISLFLLFGATGKKKIIWFFALALELAALYMTATRSAAIALIAGVILAAVLFIFWSKNLKKARLAAIVVLTSVVVLAGGVFLLSKTKYVNLFPGDLHRLTSISLNSLETRFIGADIAWKGILERPVLGWGPANFDLIFDKYYNPESLKFSFTETVWDKPHNYLLEMGTSAGFPGMAAYLAIYAAAILAIVRAKKNGNLDAPAAAIFLGLLAAKFISVLASFGTPDTLIILFGFLAYLNSLPADSFEEKKSGKIPAILSFILILVAGYFVVLNIKSFSGSRAIAGANSAVFINQIAWREDVLRLLDAKSPYKDDMVNLAVIDLAAWEGRESQIGEMLTPTLEPLTKYLADAENRNPRAYIYPFELAQVLGMRGDYLSERDAYNKAIEALDRAIKISPTRQSIYLVKGKIYLTRGDGEKAIAVLREAVKLYPEALDPHWFLGLALVGSGDIKGGLVELERGKNGGGLKPNEAFYMISLYNQEKMYEKIVPIYQSLIGAYPQNAELWANLAATYLELKDKDKASDAASQALMLDPSLRAGIGEFMKKLERLP